ncbi:MAG: ParB N-terminal domain-containing protein [bacterium]|nr:ParB N-terminal domain-containing protein [bacterium]MBU1919071.1 ParB N-terminal domain-containing protein [bacterium]
MPELKTVSLSQIKQDLLFDLSFYRDTRQLETSIKKHGILTPLTLIKTENEFIILDGARRYLAAKQLEQEMLPTLIYDKEELTTEQAFLVYLELNFFTRGFNDIERAHSLNKALKLYGSHNKIPSSFWTLVGIKPTAKSLLLYQQAMKLPTSIQKHVVTHAMPLPSVVGFLKFPDHDRETIARQLMVLPLNQNKTAEILLLLNDIARRDDLLPSQIIHEILSTIEPKQQPHQVENTLRTALKKRRFPKIQEREDQFENSKKALPHCPSLHIDHAPFFEQNYIELKTRISSQQDIDHVKNTLTHQAFIDLIKQIKG